MKRHGNDSGVICGATMRTRPGIARRQLSCRQRRAAADAERRARAAARAAAHAEARDARRQQQRHLGRLGEDALVAAVVDPLEALLGAQHGPRVRLPGRAEPLREPAQLVAVHAFEGARLGDEVVDVDVLAVALRQPGQLHQRAQRDLQVLHDEQAGAIGRVLGLAAPVQQRDLHAGAEQRADAEGRVADRLGDDRQELGDLVVEDVAALDVAELVRHHEAELVVAEQVDRARVENDDRLVDARGERIDLAAGADVELGHQRQVERVAGVDEHLVQLREGVGGDAQVAAGELDAQQPLEAPLVALADERLEAARVLQDVERLAVLGVLVGLGPQPRQRAPSDRAHTLTRLSTCRSRPGRRRSPTRSRRPG